MTSYEPAKTSVRSSDVTPLFQLYVYGAVPPETEKSIDPVLSPKHNISVADIVDFNSSVGLLMVYSSVIVHPFVSVTITVYDPLLIADKSSVVALLLQA